MILRKTTCTIGTFHYIFPKQIVVLIEVVSEFGVNNIVSETEYSQGLIILSFVSKSETYEA